MAHSSGGRLAGRPVGGWTSHRKHAPFLYFHTTRDTTRLRANRHSLPSTSEQETVAEFCAKIEQIGPEAMAAAVFANRQRTSSRSGVLKAVAVYRFACTLRAHGVDYFQDVPSPGSNVDLEREILSIPGQRSGISLHYFWMLAGSDEFVKPDRMIRRFLESVLERPVSSSEAQTLLQDTAQRLRALHPHLTPRLLDHEVWKHQRKVGDDSRGGSLKPTRARSSPGESFESGCAASDEVPASDQDPRRHLGTHTQ